MNFKEYFEVFLEMYDSFEALPEHAPYGFWVNPIGDFMIVPKEQHYKKAEEIINNNPILTQKFNEYFKKKNGRSRTSCAWLFLLDAGYTRVVFEGPIMYYTQNPRVEMSRIQKETLKDLAIFYGKHPLNDGAM